MTPRPTPDRVDPERGRRIQQLRRERGYTSAKALADASGVHPRTIDNAEAGKSISGPVLARLAETLRTSPGYLWTGEEDAPPADPYSLLRDRLDRIEGGLVKEDSARVIALRAHDKRVEDELALIRERLEALATAQEQAALVLPGLLEELVELRLAVDALRRREEPGRRTSEGP